MFCFSEKDVKVWPCHRLVIMLCNLKELLEDLGRKAKNPQLSFSKLLDGVRQNNSHVVMKDRATCFHCMVNAP